VRCCARDLVEAAGIGAGDAETALTMGKNWGWRRRCLGMTGRKVGRTSGFRESPLTSRDAKCTLSSVRRREPAEPQASTERRKRGKPEGEPQGEPEGSRENAGRRDRGPGANPARGAQPERARGSVLRWSVVRHGGFPGVAGAGLGRGLSDTTPARCQRNHRDVAPRSTGGFGRTVTRGCVASGPRMRFPVESGSAPFGHCGSDPGRQGKMPSRASVRLGTFRESRIDDGLPTFDPCTTELNRGTLCSCDGVGQRGRG